MDMTPMDKKHAGARNELAACVWLLEHGYEVFRNVSQHGSIDIVAIKDGVVEFFDVTKGYRNQFGEAWTNRKEAIGVKTLHVFPDGECVVQDAPRG